MNNVLNFSCTNYFYSDFYQSTFTKITSIISNNVSQEVIDLVTNNTHRKIVFNLFVEDFILSKNEK